MSELWQKSRWLLLTGIVIIGGLVAFGRLGEREVPRDPLAVAPAEARIVARIDVGAVLRSHLFEALSEEDDEGGVRRIEETCGYDPLDQIEDAFVFVFGPDDRPFEHLGFVAVGEMARGRENRERLVACVQRVLRDQGGAVSQVQIAGQTAISSAHGRSHAAFLGNDGVVGGDRAVVGSAIRVFREEEASALSRADLRRLWERVGTDRDAVVVARLPERWLPAVRRMARGLEGDLDALGSITALGVGLGLRNGVQLGAAFETRSSRDAHRLDAALHAQLDAVLDDPLTRVSVVGRALRRIDSEASGSEVVVTANLTDGQVDQLLELWRELRSRERERPEAEEDAEGAPGLEGEGEPAGDLEPEGEAGHDDAPAPSPEGSSAEPVEPAAAE